MKNDKENMDLIFGSKVKTVWGGSMVLTMENIKLLYGKGGLAFHKEDWMLKTFTEYSNFILLLNVIKGINDNNLTDNLFYLNQGLSIAIREDKIDFCLKISDYFNNNSEKFKNNPEKRFNLYRKLEKKMYKLFLNKTLDGFKFGNTINNRMMTYFLDNEMYEECEKIKKLI